MYLIDRDQLLQALRDHINRHGVYRHSYERMEIEKIILSIAPAKTDFANYSNLVEENGSLKHEICQYKDEINYLTSEVKMLKEMKNNPPTRAQLNDFLNTDAKSTRCGIWKKQKRFKLRESSDGRLEHDVIDVYICDRCGYTTDSLIINSFRCPKCGSLNQVI